MRKGSTAQQGGGIAHQTLQTPPCLSIRPYLTTVATDLSARVGGAKKHACHRPWRMTGNGLDVLGKLSSTLVSNLKAVLKTKLR